MKTIYSVTQAQARLPRLLRQCEAGETIAISRHDETIAYLVPRSRFEAIAETLEVLANPEAMKAIQRDRSGQGQYLPLSALDEEKNRA